VNNASRSGKRLLAPSHDPLPVAQAHAQLAIFTELLEVDCTDVITLRTVENWIADLASGRIELGDSPRFGRSRHTQTVDAVHIPVGVDRPDARLPS
jgi:hypothetical protein